MYGKIEISLVLQTHLREQPLGCPQAGSLEGMHQRLVSNELWGVIEPLLPPEPPKPKGGRPRLSNREALESIAFALTTGTALEEVSGPLGSPSGITCWRHLKEWRECGVWDEIYPMLDTCR